MSIIKVYYSDVTDCVYLDESEAIRAESETLNSSLISEFDALRKDYNQEHSQLRAKYQDKFDALLESIRSTR